MVALGDGIVRHTGYEGRFRIRSGCFMRGEYAKGKERQGRRGNMSHKKERNERRRACRSPVESLGAGCVFSSLGGQSLATLRISESANTVSR